MHRFFLSDQNLTVEEIVDLSAIQHQLRRVLRMQPGDEVTLLTGDGFEYAVRLERISACEASGRVVGRRLASGEPRTTLTLFQCALKGPKLEFVLQKGTELGVSRFVPVISERTIARPASALESKLERWRSVIREAAEQSGRGRLPEMSAPALWDKAIGDVRTRQTTRLIPWESATGAASLGEVIGNLVGNELSSPSVSLLIGPEGGLSEGEVTSAVECGWQPVTLGPRVLRAETAAIAAVTLVLGALGDLGGKH